MEADCVWKAVAADQGKGDLDFARAFIALLDYSSQEAIGPRRVIVTNQQVTYPALSGLMLVGKAAQPLVLEALTKADSSDEARKNAAIVVLLLNRNDVIEGARRIAAAYWNLSDQATAKKVLDAAIYATRACGPELQAVCQAEIGGKTSNGVLELRVEQMTPADGAAKAFVADGVCCAIVMRLRNVSEEPAEVMTTIPEIDFSVEVTDQHGRNVPLTPYGERLPKTAEERASWMLSRQVRKLLPGEEYAVVFHLGAYYQMNPSGSYSVKVSRLVAKRELSGKVVESKLSRVLAVSATRADK